MNTKQHSNKKKQFYFSAERRIKKRSSFLVAQKNGRKLRSGSFLICVYKSDIKDQENTTLSRIGITVTTKVSKFATKRNLLKRRIREVFRLNYSNIKKGLDFVVIAQDGAADLSYKEIESQIIESFKNALLFKQETNKLTN